MPPSKHSGSSRSAHKDSDQIPSDQNYILGDYSFRIERTSVPGSTNDKIEAICTKDGKNARKSIQIPSSAPINGWYVEANGSEATVYAVVQVPKSGTSSDLDTSPILQPLAVGSSLDYEGKWGDIDYYEHVSGRNISAWRTNNLPVGTYGAGFAWVAVSGTPGATVHVDRKDSSLPGTSQDVPLSSTFTYQGKTVYYTAHQEYMQSNVIAFSAPLSSGYGSPSVENIAWTIIYGYSEEYEEEQVMVGRFAIDLEDAGGVGPGSDWDDPGDYDDDWEPEEPTHTLYVTVTGALSGRHNDPIEDPSYSYIPSDKDTVKDYGCGGDGGHGGGGGAGASTVVVHKFATNQANSKEVTAIARRHGYGSGGGKGGKGGDGCILVYY